MFHPLTRRIVPLLGLALAVAAAAGCATGPVPGGPAGPSAPGFPVTIRGYLGTATIPAPPRRVVTLANGDTDAAVALGVVPEAVLRDTDTPDGVFPWLAGKVDPARVTLLDVSQGVPIERIAELRPDVILATNVLNRIDDLYAQLSQIAPVVTRPTRRFGADWPATTALIGKALGREAAVPAANAAVNDRIAQERARRPNLAGRTVSVTWVAAPGKILVINDPADVTARFLEQLGLSLPPSLVSAGGHGVSPEQVGLLQADLVIVAYNSPELRRSFEPSPLFQGLPAVRSGHYLPVDLPTMTQLRSPTAAGIPWLLDRLDPGLAAVGR